MKKGNFRRKKFNRKRKNTYKVFFLVLVGMTLGFAAVNTTLQLIGTLNISRTTWNIHWENPTKVGGVNATQDVHLKQNDNTTVEYQVNLANQGDYYEFTVDAKNEGTIDAMITGFDNKVYENNVEVTKPDYLDFIVTYANGATIANNNILKSGKKETYKVKIMYKTGLAADELPTSTRNLKFTFTVTYMQAENNATPKEPVSFAADSWDTIAYYNNSNIYQVGDEKEITMDVNEDGVDETYHIMVVNKTTCTTETSQTACGLVLQFKELLNITNSSDQQMNSTATSEGGWPATNLYTYLNTTVYNKIPSDLKNNIIDTTVISGHGDRDASNFTTTDKLYILSTKEIGLPSSYDSVTTETRLLDYYEYGLSASANAKRVKYSYGTSTASIWWLRSATMSSSSAFDHIAASGGMSDHYGTATFSYGVLPAFRLG